MIVMVSRVNNSAVCLLLGYHHRKQALDIRQRENRSDRTCLMTCAYAAIILDMGSVNVAWEWCFNHKGKGNIKIYQSMAMRPTQRRATIILTWIAFTPAWISNDINYNIEYGMKLLINSQTSTVQLGLYTFKSIRYDTYRIVFGSIHDTYHDTYR